MGMLEVLQLLSCKSGDELFEKTAEILERIGVSVYNEDRSYKDIYTLLCEISEVWNNNTK